MKKCPKCGFDNVKIYNYLGIKTLKCNNCGFDEAAVYEAAPEQNTSQKAKGSYSVYKTGGSRRSVKK